MAIFTVTVFGKLIIVVGLNVAVTFPVWPPPVLKVKTLLDAPVPYEFVTAITPVLPLPNTAVICVVEVTVKLWTAVPPIVTLVTFMKLPPLMTIVFPVLPDIGENEVTVGIVTPVKVNVPDDVPVPAVLLTVTEPVAPFPTIAVI